MASLLTLSRRSFIMLAAGGLTSACTAIDPRMPSVPRLARTRRILVRRAGQVTSVDLEEYALGSALAEVSPLGESAAAVERIFDVQAVLARSFGAAHLGRHRAEGFDVCDTAHCQLYDPGRLRTSRFAAAARQAVQRTAGVILSYGDRPAEALFHADCGGSTAAADAIWGGAAVPYLQPAHGACGDANHRSWNITLSREELRVTLNADGRSRVGRSLTDLRVGRRDVSGRATAVTVAGAAGTHALRGEDLRAILNRRLSDKGILSTRLFIQRAGNGYQFRGTGFGHGVGLCQLGAAARARHGESLERIFGAYFKGAEIKKV